MTYFTLRAWPHIEDSIWRACLGEIAPIADGATGEEPMETNGQPRTGGHQSRVNLPEDAWAAKT